MGVGLEKWYADSCKNLIREANKIAKSGYKGKPARIDLLKSDISVEKKKEKLVKALHEHVLATFAAKRNSLANLRNNADLIREMLNKLKAINHYLEETLLGEIGMAGTSLTMKALKSRQPEKFLESKRGLPKEYIAKIEHTVYRLIRDIVFFDQKLLKNYGKKEFKALKIESVEVKDIERVLRTQSELLDCIEAKIPPKNKITKKLFEKSIFNRWVPFVFALLANFEAEYDKERVIFSKIKNNSRLRKRIESKIKHIVKEKEGMLKIQEKRALAMRKFGKINDDYRQVLHGYVAASEL